MSRILWVEDEPYFMEGHILALREAGYEVEVIENASSALSRLTWSTYALIIMDIILPNDLKDPGPDNGMSTGVYLVEKIRKELKLMMPIVVLTIVSNPAVHDRLSEIGSQFGKLVVRVKPFLPSELLDEVQTMIADAGLKA